MPPELSYYGSLLEPIGDGDLRTALLAANINILRRNAPFAYLFTNGSSLESWSNSDSFGELAVEARYRSQLEKIQLQTGVWLDYPEWHEETVTVVTAILAGDILPFVDDLDEDKYCLLCLPDARSLNLIDQTIFAADSTHAALVDLLFDGGCLISAIDYRAFSVKTLDHQYGRYFPSDPKQSYFLESNRLS